MEKQTIRIRKVGAVTFGLVLVVTGLIFLLHLFIPRLDYSVVLHFWPVILITLGVEVLTGSRWKTYEVRDAEGKILEQNDIVYDVPAILMTMLLTGFAVCMGMLDWAFTHAQVIHF